MNKTDRSLWPAEWTGEWMIENFEPGLVSVVIPTYNRAKLILETLDSVHAQTYRPIEVLIVDDGSTDATASLIETWETATETADFQVRYIRQENAGGQVARNRGLLESKGEFIQFLDSDDLLHPTKFEKQIALLQQKPDVELAYSRACNFNGSVDWSATMTVGHDCPEADRLLRCIKSDCGGLFQTAIGVYRRSVCVKNGPWDERLKRQQDTEYNVRMVLNGFRPLFLDGVLTALRVGHDCRISAASSLKELTEFFEAYAVMREKMILKGRYCGAVEAAMANQFFHFARSFLSLYGSGGAELAGKSLQLGRSISFSMARRFRFVVWSWLVGNPGIGGVVAGTLNNLELALRSMKKRVAT